jgi:hypothetical protein
MCAAPVAAELIFVIIYYFISSLHYKMYIFYLQQGHIILCVLLPSYTLAPIQKNTGFYSKCKTVQNDHKMYQKSLSINEV